MATELGLPESEEEDSYPDYIQNNPRLRKYAAYIHQILDMMIEEREAFPDDPQMDMFQDCLMTIHRRIAFDGALEELDRILRMHFADYYSEKDSLNTVLDYSLSLDN